MRSVEYRVIQKKLLFIHCLVYLHEELLAKQICCTQKEFSLPGFVKEGRDLPHIVEKNGTESHPVKI